MFASLTTKLALRKAGIKGNPLDFSQASASGGKSDKDPAPAEGDSAGWASWMTPKALPLTLQPWLTPVSPPVPLSDTPQVGEVAPRDRDRRLECGGGKKIIVVFLRCVGCAFAQKSFLALRTLGNRHQGKVTCVAVSHSSREATRRWMDLLGGAWNVDVIIDEDRAVYAAWGLGLGSVWTMFNPTTQIQAWKEKGWLGVKVAGAVQRTAASAPAARSGNGSGKGNAAAKGAPDGAAGTSAADDGDYGGPSTVMGNKWQQAGVFAVDGRRIVVLAVKAERPDNCLEAEMEEAVRALGL